MLVSHILLHIYPQWCKNLHIPITYAYIKSYRTAKGAGIVTSHLQLVGKSADEALYHYMRKNRLNLPERFTTPMLEALAQGIMDIEVSNILEASRYERNHQRRAYRNGYRDSIWQTQFGDVAIRIPKLRSGSYYPVVLDAHEKRLAKFLIRTFLQQIKFTDIQALLNDLEIDAYPYQISDLQAILHDVIISHSHSKSGEGEIEIDTISFHRRGQKQYLALAIENDEIIGYDTTAYPDSAFWQDFVRRINHSPTTNVSYTIVSQIRPLIQLNIKPTTPQLSLVA